jgi:hypothetical protein
VIEAALIVFPAKSITASFKIVFAVKPLFNIQLPAVNSNALYVFPNANPVVPVP